MTRYFLDTGVLVGLTFLHDGWRTEAERVFDSDNTFYVNRIVIFEYCNRERGKSREETNIDWESNNGVFGRILSKARMAQWNVETRLESLSNDELNLENLVEVFLEEVGVFDQEHVDEDLIEEYIRPRIREFLIEAIDGRPVTQSVAMEAMMALCSEVVDGAHRKRDQVCDRVQEHNVEASNRDMYVDQLAFINGRDDTDILASVAYLEDMNILKKIITTDNSHIYSNRERIKFDVGVTVVYIKDELAEPPELNSREG